MTPPARARCRAALALAACLVLGASGRAGAVPYVPFESGQVRPLAMSPDGARLFAVNTPDNRLEVFGLSGMGLEHQYSVPVGLEPVAVAARSDDEVWVVNHASDSVSIVDLAVSPPRVTRTLLVGDEPRDLVFAGPGGGRAFITAARRGQNVPFDPQLDTPALGRADVWVFDAASPGTSLEGDPIAIVTLFGNTPRALATSPDGGLVFAAVFRSGNGTTIVAPPAVCDGGATAAPCLVEGALMPGGLPAPNENVEMVPQLETGLIVREDPVTGIFEDELGRDWGNAVPFTLPDLDVFAIDANATPPVELQARSRVGTVLYNMAVNPVNGNLYVSNTEARNEVRFEPELRGNFHRSQITVLDAVDVEPRHLNSHIDYAVSPSPPGVADDSLALPMGMAVSSDGAALYVAAYGSNKVAILDTADLENDTFVPDAADHVTLVGGGPSGLVLDETRDRLYVLTRFDNAVEVVDLTSRQTLETAPLFDPEPVSIREGRKFLYDATLTSSNGEAACGSCHVFGDWDGLGWDLGNPDAIVMTNPNPGTEEEPPGTFVDFHPMKGPATTQTLHGISTHGPMHWRGDRTGGSVPGGDSMDERQAFAAFNPAFVTLNGSAAPLTPAEMELFTDFMLSVFLPPNPHRALDDELTPAQDAERQLFETGCASSCHTLDPAAGLFGTSRETILLETFGPGRRPKKPASPRFAYQKLGKFSMFPLSALKGTPQAPVGAEVAGFGTGMDGSGAFQEFTLPTFLAVFPTDLAPVVGQQVTIGPGNLAAVDVNARVDLLAQRAAAPFDSFLLGSGATECDLVAKTVEGGVAKGYARLADGSFLPDDGGPAISETALRAKADPLGAAQEITFTCVPPGSGIRIGIDRDEDTLGDGVETDTGSFVDASDTGTSPILSDTDGDGFDDGTEVAAGSDPTEPTSVPAQLVPLLPTAFAILLAALLAATGAPLAGATSGACGCRRRRAASRRSCSRW